MMSQELRVALLGLGSIGKNFLRAVQASEERLAQRYDLKIKIVAIADSRGAAVNRDGIPPEVILAHKQAGHSAATCPGCSTVSPQEMVQAGTADYLLDAAPSNYRTGEPGLSLIRQTLQAGKHVVSADKGPIVLAYHELHALAQAHHSRLAFSGTVGGGLPVINILRRELVGARITAFRGVLNSTSNYVLTRLEESTDPFIDALKEAQEKGIAENDPLYDINGQDAAAKLVIIANAAMGLHVTLADVETEGIVGIDLAQIIAARASNLVIKLVASIILHEGQYRLSVSPHWLAQNSFLASINGWEMGFEVHTDLFETVYAKIDEQTSTPSASAMLRDLINIAHGFPI